MFKEQGGHGDWDGARNKERNENSFYLCSEILNHTEENSRDGHHFEMHDSTNAAKIQSY